MSPNFLTLILTNKKRIVLFYRILYLFTVTTIVTLLIPQLHPRWHDFGLWAADLSVVFFSLAVLPGVFGRIGVTGFLKQTQVILMLFRRQNGVLMYLLAIGHYLLIRLFPFIFLGSNLISLSLFEIFGMTAFLLTAPLFLTSNDFSQRKLAHRWSILHRLVYIICWLIFLHLATMPRVVWATILIYLVSLLEIISWTIKLGLKPQNPSLKPQT